MAVVTIVGLILNVSGIDGDTTRFLSGAASISSYLLNLALPSFDNASVIVRQACFAVINVADGADVYVRLISFKLAALILQLSLTVLTANSFYLVCLYARRTRFLS